MERPRPSLHAVALELTRYCNQKCDYCYNAFRGESACSSQGHDRWPERLERLLEAFAIDHVTLTGGEPFAYRGFSGCSSSCRRRGCRADDLQRRADRRRARGAARAVRAALRAGHAQRSRARAARGARRARGTSTRRSPAVAALRRHGVRVVGCIVVTRKNADRVGEILALWREPRRAPDRAQPLQPGRLRGGRRSPSCCPAASSS